MRRPPAVARILERVTGAVRRIGSPSPGQTLLIACSGGPDSICLLHCMHRLRRLLRVRLAVFHFDHRLRDGSDKDAAYVRRQAEKLGVPLHLRVADDAPGRGESVEAWARHARYGALAEVLEASGADLAALGHTLDDQAETVLLGLVRGGGMDAVAGMPESGTVPPLGAPVVRPLLTTTREEVAAFCRALGLRPRRDPSNDDPRFLRNRVRHEVLPLMGRVLDRNVAATLARTAGHVRDDAHYLDRLASEAAMSTVLVDDAGILLSARTLGRLARPLAARVVRDALLAATGVGGGEVTAAHIDAVLDLVAGRPGRSVDLPGALLASRDREYVRVSRSSPVGAGPSRGTRRARPT